MATTDKTHYISRAADAYDGVEILTLFAHLRLELDRRGLMVYLEDSDPLYVHLNKAEIMVRDRLSNPSLVPTPRV